MLNIRVTSIDGASPERPIEASFDAGGGTIGRSDDNRLVLADPARHISRLHARVAFVGGAFEMTVEGANPVEVNGAPVGQGRKVRLHDGDELRIGGYRLSVIEDPTRRASKPSNDLLVAFGPPSAADPLGLSLDAAPSNAPRSAPDARRPGPPAGIPDDFDPLAFPGSTRAPRTPTEQVRLPTDLDLGLGGPGGAAPSLDEMFGLGAGALGPDPFAEGPLAKPVSRRDAPAPASLDPLVDFDGAPPAASSAPVPDIVPEIQGSFRLPVARPAPPPATPSSPEPVGETYLSWEDSQSPPAASQAHLAAQRARGAVQPEATHIEPAPRPHSVAPVAPPMGMRPPNPPLVAPAELPAAGQAPAASDDLLRAFVVGLGMDRQVLVSLTPEAMEQIGRLFREATQGTLDLLMARALTKREVRAEATMIVGQNNNPLKFSPSVEAALSHLLAPQGRGFMPPVEAMRDAYGDLRSHQFGFMAGLRAALAGVLKRFDPTVLEQRLTHKSLVDSVLPINRRAKLWDLYEQLYRDIAREAEDDFHKVFGDEFVRAYEEQVARLAGAAQDGRGAPEPPGPRGRQ